MSAPLPSPARRSLTAGGAASAAAGLITWALTYYVPAWHSGIPPAVAPLIPAAVTIIGFVGGYVMHHRVTSAEVAAVESGVLHQHKAGTPPVDSDKPAGASDTSSTGGGP